MRRLGFGVSILVTALALGCSSPESETAQDTSGSGAKTPSSSKPTAPTVADVGGFLDETRTLGPSLRLDSLAVWPVYTTAPLDLGAFVTLEEAQAKGLAELSELGGEQRQQAANAPARANQDSDVLAQVQQVLNDSGSAQVGALQLVNKGDRPILVLAGTIVKGGKQDRQIGQDFVVAPHSKVKVDAFCVEQGRWNAQRDGAGTRGQFKGQAVLASKGVRFNAQYFSDQGKVWDEVSAANSAAGNAPATSTYLATIDEDDADAKAKRGGNAACKVQAKDGTWQTLTEDYTTW